MEWVRKAYALRLGWTCCFPLAKANYSLALPPLASKVRVTGRAILEVAQSAASLLRRFAFERHGMALSAKTGAVIGVAGRCYQRPWSGSRHGPRWQRLRRERCSRSLQGRDTGVVSKRFQHG